MGSRNVQQFVSRHYREKTLEKDKTLPVPENQTERNFYASRNRQLISLLPVEI